MRISATTSFGKEQLNSTFQLSNARAIVNTRNRVIHGYDSVTPKFLWSLVIKHIPALKSEIEQLLKDKEKYDV
ncbi:hypothetical protein Barb6_00822 [Bacteroidales bacterium Barb6]|nr:hypothetical protein Barb6_00822 [Bacteroidales bacterium Barb6]